MRKFLYITHLSGKRVNRFWISSIEAAHQLGYEFHLACNMDEADHPDWEEECNAYNIITHQIDFNRNPLHPVNIHAAKQLRQLLNQESYDIVHCNTPVGGLIGRICGRRAGVPKVIYQAHGFHFWKGAPLINWLIYYPIERCLAHLTDVLITINKEDFERAKKFKANRIVYIPGVGIDMATFCKNKEKGERLRRELGIPTSAPILLSVGELIKRKNHRVVIETISAVDNAWYIICGNGPLMDEYKELAKKKGISDRIIFAGYRTDIQRFYDMADVFVIPSYQEGLPVSLMEAMASGLVCVVSDIRGNIDLISNNDYRFKPDDRKRLANIINRVLNDKEIMLIEGNRNQKEVAQYNMSTITEQLIRIYNS